MSEKKRREKALKHFSSEGRESIRKTLKEWQHMREKPSVNTMKCAVASSFAAMSEDSFARIQLLMKLEESQKKDRADAVNILRRK